MASTPPPWTNVSKNTVISVNEEFIPALTRFLLDTRTVLEATFNFLEGLLCFLLITSLSPTKSCHLAIWPTLLSGHHLIHHWWNEVPISKVLTSNAHPQWVGDLFTGVLFLQPRADQIGFSTLPVTLKGPKALRKGKEWRHAAIRLIISHIRERLTSSWHNCTSKPRWF